MPSDLWRLLLEAAQENKAVQVTVSPGMRINKVKRNRGRPRVRGVLQYGHYAGYILERGGRPKCYLRGCKKRLKVNQCVACCVEHENKIKIEISQIMEKLNVRQQQAA